MARTFRWRCTVLCGPGSKEIFEGEELVEPADGRPGLWRGKPVYRSHPEQGLVEIWES